jgi:hypothetical protein
VSSFDDGRFGKAPSPDTNLNEWGRGRALAEGERVAKAQREREANPFANGEAAGASVAAGAGLSVIIATVIGGVFVAVLGAVPLIIAAALRVIFLPLDARAGQLRFKALYRAACYALLIALLTSAAAGAALAAWGAPALESWVALAGCVCLHAAVFAVVVMRILPRRSLTRLMSTAALSVGLQAAMLPALQAGLPRLDARLQLHLPKRLIPGKVMAWRNSLTFAGPEGWQNELPSVARVAALGGDSALRATHFGYMMDLILALGEVRSLESEAIRGLPPPAAARFNEYANARRKLLDSAQLLSFVVDRRYGRQDDRRRAVLSSLISAGAQRAYWQQHERIMLMRYAR